MKKLVLVMLVLICVCFVGCYYDVEKTSLDEYIIEINEQEFGFSEFEIDRPQEFLPTKTFITDFEYTEGKYYLHEEDTIKPKKERKAPHTAFLMLKYNNDVYEEAKQVVFENIPVYRQQLYYIENYCFYVNVNFMDEFPEVNKDLPKWFTMVCYNDANSTLIFLGFYDFLRIDEKYYTDFYSNFESFIITYYGEIYDFTK